MHIAQGLASAMVTPKRVNNQELGKANVYQNKSAENGEQHKHLECLPHIG